MPRDHKSLHLMLDLLKLRFGQLRQHGLDRRRGLHPRFKDRFDRLLAARLEQVIEVFRITSNGWRNFHSRIHQRRRDRFECGQDRAARSHAQASNYVSGGWAPAKKAMAAIIRSWQASPIASIAIAPRASIHDGCPAKLVVGALEHDFDVIDVVQKLALDSSAGERRFEILEQVVARFQSHRQPHQPVGDSGASALCR